MHYQTKIQKDLDSKHTVNIHISFIFRYPTLLAPTSPKDVAAKIISAQRQEINEKSIPSYWKPLNDVFK